jgi:hypothetical protein
MTPEAAPEFIHAAEWPLERLVLVAEGMVRAQLRLHMVIHSHINKRRQCDRIRIGRVLHVDAHLVVGPKWTTQRFL